MDQFDLYMAVAMLVIATATLIATIIAL